jgi:Kef-type K+ transport system membrane component KefB
MMHTFSVLIVGASIGIVCQLLSQYVVLKDETKAFQNGAAIIAAIIVIISLNLFVDLMHP